MCKPQQPLEYYVASVKQILGRCCSMQYIGFPLCQCSLHVEHMTPMLNTWHRCWTHGTDVEHMTPMLNTWYRCDQINYVFNSVNISLVSFNVKRWISEIQFNEIWTCDEVNILWFSANNNDWCKAKVKFSEILFNYRPVISVNIGFFMVLRQQYWPTQSQHEYCCPRPIKTNIHSISQA